MGETITGPVLRVKHVWRSDIGDGRQQAGVESVIVRFDLQTSVDSRQARSA